MKALVTGCSGFVGMHLISHLLEQGDEVFGLSLSDVRLPCPSAAIDLRDRAQVERVVAEFEPDAIYHLAGISFVPQAAADLEHTLAVNVGGVYSIYEAAARLTGPVKILLVSTAEVYGRVRPHELPFSEMTPLRPANDYALSKVMSEAVPLRFTEFEHVTTVIARPCNHLGAGQDGRFMAPSFARQLAMIHEGRAEPRIFVGNLDAERDFSDVRDIVRAYRLAMLRGSGIYTLGSGSPTAVKTILETLISISGLAVEIRRDPARMRPAEVPTLYCSIERAKRDLGWEPAIPLRETLTWVYESFLEEERHADSRSRGA